VCSSPDPSKQAFLCKVCSSPDPSNHSFLCKVCSSSEPSNHSFLCKLCTSPEHSNHSFLCKLCSSPEPANHSFLCKLCSSPGHSNHSFLCRLFHPGVCVEIRGLARAVFSTAGCGTNRIQQLWSWKGNVFSKDQSWFWGKGGGRGRKGSVRGLVYTARVLVAPHIFSICEGMEGNPQNLEENGRKKE
jgi:hypothetical protein